MRVSQASMIWHLISVGIDERVGGDMLFDTGLYLAVHNQKYPVRVEEKG